MKWIVIATFSMLFVTACVPTIVHKTADVTMPSNFTRLADTVSTGSVNWRTFYNDTNLIAIIDSALRHNQDLNMVLQGIDIAQNDVTAKRGEYLPFVKFRAGAGVEKSGRYTRNGAVDENVDVTPGQRLPTPLPTIDVGADVSWEVDIWKKLRNATQASALRYLSTIEGTNFMVTTIVAEIASSYYELMALDNLLDAINANINIQKNALRIVELQKQAARTTELAVKKFEAEVLKNESRRYDVQQRIIETENHINFMAGRFPQHIDRDSKTFLDISPDSLHAGIPTQLLQNRPDVKQAELELAATDLDIDVAKARFYPSLNIVAGIGYQAMNAQYLVSTPESMIFSIAGELMVPVINRNAITASYLNASARQIQAAYSYERTILNSYVEVANQLAKVENTQSSYQRKRQQVQALTESVDIANSLFLSARADYMEVLMTQRDALEAKMDLIETKSAQLHAYVNVYQALGGGWR
ncbi:TolC family protein [soil metagenome]